MDAGVYYDGMCVLYSAMGYSATKPCRAADIKLICSVVQCYRNFGRHQCIVVVVVDFVVVVVDYVAVTVVCRRVQMQKLQ